jgi:hypothetical protein
VPQRRFSPTGFFSPAKERTETSGDVIGDEFTSTPDSRQLDFSPMRLGVAKTARESAKSPDEFEAPSVEPVFPRETQVINYAQNRL